MLAFEPCTETKTKEANEAQQKGSQDKAQKEDLKVCPHHNFFKLCACLAPFDALVSAYHSELLCRVPQKPVIVKKAKHSVAGIYANLAKNLSDEPPKPEQFSLLQHRLAPVDRY